MYYQAMTNLKNLESKIDSLQSQIQKLPDGKIIFAKNGMHWKWYLGDGCSKPRYIPKKDIELAQKLTQKKFLILQLENALAEKAALQSYLQHHNPNASTSEIEFLNHPEHKKLLDHLLTPVADDLLKWQNSPYEKSKNHPESLTHKAACGNLVRSKSEALIVLYLTKNQIPFHYEEVLYLTSPVNGKTVTFFPDFTIRHPKTKEYFYWDHFGMMDEPSYIQTTTSKLQTYFSNGILPGHQLITTYETKDRPLSSDMIEQVLSRYFLEDRNDMRF